jgi:cobalt-zinc-cadmium efflux system outer membrane protein
MHLNVHRPLRMLACSFPGFPCPAPGRSLLGLVESVRTQSPRDLYSAWRAWLRPFAAPFLTIMLAAAAMAQTPGPGPSPAPTDQVKTAASAGLTGNQSVPQRLTLQSASDLLISNNLAVVASRYNVDILRAQRIAAGLRPNPTMTMSATQLTVPRNFQHPEFFVKTDPNNAAANSSYTVEVDQLIERGDKRRLRSEQADLNTRAAEAQLQDAIRQQLFQLKTAFFTAVLARENLGVARENLQFFERSDRILRVQVKEGYSAGVDLKRIELQQLQFNRDVVTAEQTYQQSLRDVFNFIGVGDAPSSAGSTQLISTSAGTTTTSPFLEADLKVVEGNLDIIPTVLWIDDLRKMALANRPDVKAAQYNLDAARSGFALAQAQRVRDVTVGGQYARNGSDNTVGVVVGVPLKIGPKAHAAIAQATATRLQAEAQLRQNQTQALTDVEKAFTAYRISRDRLRLYTGNALRTATDVRRIEEISYREGAKGLLDFLDAQRTYNQTLTDYNQARYDYLMSLYQLEFATGSRIVK